MEATPEKSFEVRPGMVIELSIRKAALKSEVEQEHLFNQSGTAEILRLWTGDFLFIF